MTSYIRAMTSIVAVCDVKICFFRFRSQGAHSKNGTKENRKACIIIVSINSETAYDLKPKAFDILSYDLSN